MYMYTWTSFHKSILWKCQLVLTGMFPQEPNAENPCFYPRAPYYYTLTQLFFPFFFKKQVKEMCTFCQFFHSNMYLYSFVCIQVQPFDCQFCFQFFFLLYFLVYRSNVLILINRQVLIRLEWQEPMCTYTDPSGKFKGWVLKRISFTGWTKTLYVLESSVQVHQDGSL